MTKQIHILLFWIIFPITLWCSNYNKIPNQNQKFYFKNGTNGSLDVTIYYTKNGLPHNLVFRPTGDRFFKSVTVHNIYNKKIIVYSYKSHRHNKVNLYYKVVPIKG